MAVVTCVEPLLLDEGSGTFGVSQDGDDLRPIACSFYTSGVLSLPALLESDGSSNFLPLELIRLSPHHPCSLLGFINLKDQDRCTVWFINTELGYIDQDVVTLTDLATLYRLAGAQPQEAPWLSRLPEADQHTYRAGLKRISEMIQAANEAASSPPGELALADATPETTAFYQSLVQRLTPGDVAGALQTQLQEQPDSLPGCDIPRLLEIWDVACRRAVYGLGYGTLSDCMVFEHRYCLLKEIYLLLTGRDLVFNPFSGLHQEASLSCFIPTDLSISTSFSVNKACLFQQGDVQIAEIRGPGYSMMPTGYLIGAQRAGIACYAVTGWLPSDFEKFARSALHYIRAALETPQSDTDPIHLVNLSLATNLGHTLWNDISGYYLLKDLLAAYPELQQNIKIISYQEGGTSFSSQSYNAFFHPFVVNDLGNLSLEIVSDFASLASLPRPMMLKSLVVAPEVVENMRLHYAESSPATPDAPQTGSEEAQIRVLINLRAHNKSLLNTRECLDAIFSSPSVASVASQLFFCLEMHHSASEMGAEISTLLDSHGVAHQSLVDSTLDELCQEISRSSIVIAPVGSALVLPTWVWNRNCVIHADPLHMSQLPSWPLVAPYFPDLVENLHTIPLESITSKVDRLYSNYWVEPEAFRQQFEVALQSVAPRSLREPQQV